MIDAALGWRIGWQHEGACNDFVDQIEATGTCIRHKVQRCYFSCSYNNCNWISDDFTTPEGRYRDVPDGAILTHIDPKNPYYDWIRLYYKSCPLCTVCNNATQYETRPCANELNRNCFDCTVCLDGTYAEVPCGGADGKTDRKCSNCTICTADEFQEGYMHPLTGDNRTYDGLDCVPFSACNDLANGIWNGSHCEVCPPGTYKSNLVTCQACEAGTFNDVYGALECSACPVDSFAPVGSVSCTLCSSVCGNCLGSGLVPIGTMEGDCRCSVGFEFNATELGCSTECVNGWSSYYASPDQVNSIAEGVCYPCPTGTYWTADLKCTPCPAGMFNAVAGGSECQQCPPGSYSNQTGSSECTACPSGKYSITTGLSAVTDCITCNPGFFCSNGTRYPCVKKTTSNTGAASASECFCVEKHYMLSDGTCVMCPNHHTCPDKCAAVNHVTNSPRLGTRSPEEINKKKTAALTTPEKTEEEIKDSFIPPEERNVLDGEQHGRARAPRLRQPPACDDRGEPRPRPDARLDRRGDPVPELDQPSNSISPQRRNPGRRLEPGLYDDPVRRTGIHDGSRRCRRCLQQRPGRGGVQGTTLRRRRIRKGDRAHGHQQRPRHGLPDREDLTR
eukprot:768817-Hanusia_phi.AAC.2